MLPRPQALAKAVERVGGNCGVHCWALWCLLTCGMHFAHLSSPVVVSPICLYLVDVVCERVRVQGSICACCVRTMGRHQGRRSLFSVWFHLVRRGGRGFLMVFHLNTVGLVPVATPVTSLFISVPPSSALSRHTWGLQAQAASVRCVPIIPTEMHRHTQMHTEPECVCVCVPSPRVQRYTRSGWFLSYACILYCFLSFIEYLNKQSILEVSCHCTFFHPLVFLRRLWSQSSSIS